MKLQNSFGDFTNLAKENPEVALAKAIILQAIIDIRSQDKFNIAKENKQEAYKWIFEDNTHLSQICTDSKLDPSYVRKITKEESSCKDIIEKTKD